jgi:hypothetical protein
MEQDGDVLLQIGDQSADADPRTLARRPFSVEGGDDDSRRRKDAGNPGSSTGSGQEQPLLLRPSTVSKLEGGGVEECPTCFAPLGLELVGVPEGCAHRFCMTCIKGVGS